ncbi:MAG TPA: M1 family aminopeptidase [Flavobacteriales bacterium]|nr:M1 family aminopeptidase [Flavobacteriales bacterium]
MRHFLLALSALAVLPSWAQLDTGSDAVEQIAAQERGRPWPGQLRSGAPPTRGYDMKYARCHWDLDPAVRYIAGTVTFRFTATAPLSEVVLDLSDSLEVSAVHMHGSPVSYTHGAGDLLTVTLPEPMAAGALDSITVEYQGVPPHTGFGSFAATTHNGTPALWTLSEPYGAKDWWPCKQDLNDKIDSVDLHITTPLGYRAGANGLLTGADTVGQQVTWHWRHRYPVDHYLIGVAVTDYEVDEQYAQLSDGSSLLMLTYAYPEHYTQAVNAATSLLPVISLYDSLFGRYPFADEKYGHAEFGWGGGMEHQTMSFMGTYNKEVACHELAHQWFGDKVTCHSWAELWLNEGFATYLAALNYQYLEPFYWPIWKRQKVDHVTSQPGGSVFVTDTVDQGRLFDSRLTYNKAALVVHMLRWVCGDSAFYAGLRNYLDDPALAYGTATTGDLQAHLEAASGLDLDGFFADWYYGEGYPSYTTIWGQDPDGTVTVNLSQVPSHPSVDFFEMPVPLLFRGGGTDSTIVLDNTVNDQFFSFHLPFEVDTVLFDPDIWLISAQNFVTRVDDPQGMASSVAVYPNPSSSEIHWHAPMLGRMQSVVIYDATGRKVLKGGAHATSLDISRLPAGQYVLELKGSAGRRHGRFIKE